MVMLIEMHDLVLKQLGTNNRIQAINMLNKSKFNFLESLTVN